MRGLGAATLLGLALALAGCLRPREDRAEWLRGALHAADGDLLARDPAVVARKYGRMEKTSFAFFRGTAGLTPADPTAFPAPGGRQIAVLGDPHPENVGTFRATDGTRLVDWNDFDRVGHGWFVDDLRRLGVGLALAADMADVKRKDREKVVEAAVAGYRAEIAALVEGQPPLRLRVETAFGGDLEALLAPPEDEDPFERGDTASAEEEALARAVLAAYPGTLHERERYRPAMFTPSRIAKLHAVIGSFPVLRLRVVVAGPTAAPEDDWTLELKEARPVHARTVVALQRALQEVPDADPLLGFGEAGGRSFRVRSVSPDQRRLDVERIVRQQEGPGWRKRDFRAFAHTLGRLLARAHARAPGSDGNPGLAAIAPVAREEGLARETVTVVLRQAAAIEDDWRRFKTLRAERGPLLGWRGAPAR